MGLITFVHVFDGEGQPHAFGPDDQVPDWAVPSIGAHCWEDGVKPSVDSEKGDVSGSNQEGGSGAGEEPGGGVRPDGQGESGRRRTR